MATIDVRKAETRPHTQISWLDSHHSFSFGGHWDPTNTGHGLLLVNNDDRIAPGTGFSTHPHRDMEIVTWVLSGELEHKDTLAEAHFVQMWVVPDTESIDPGYEQLDINAELDRGGLVPIASGQGHDAAISIRQKGAVLWGGRLKPGEAVKVPDAPNAHVFLPTGSATLEGAGELAEGDAVRLTGAGAPVLTAGPQGTEVLIWTTS